MNDFQVNYEQFIIREYDGEIIFINTKDGQSHVIDDVGTIMYKLILSNSKTGDVLEKLSEIFPNVKQETLEEDLVEFRNDLLKKNILIA